MPFSLAIETSSRHGSVTFGRDGRIVETVTLDQQRRHNVELIPAVDALSKRHGARCDDIDQVYVSIGPGSFTGLRVAVATVKMLAYVNSVRIAAVPTVEVVRDNAPEDRQHVAVCLNSKGDRMYCGVYRRDGRSWRCTAGPELMTSAQLVELVKHDGVAVLGDHLPAHDWPTNIEVLGPALAVPRSEIVWQLGRRMIESGACADPFTLTPLYARPPEAVELWEKNRSGREK